MSTSEQIVSPTRGSRLILVTGEEGAGKSTIIRALLPHTRITRAKQTTQEWRDMVDLVPEDRTIRQATGADYRYVGVDTTGLDITETVQRIKGAIPEVYAQ